MAKKKRRAKNCKYWRLKADAKWSELVRSIGYCEICGRPGKPVKDGRLICGLNAHHLITKGSALKFRHDLNNGICLCVRCHLWGGGEWNEIAAHGNLDQQTLFWESIEKNNPKMYEWYRVNKNNKIRVEINYEEAYHRLCQILALVMFVSDLKLVP